MIFKNKRDGREKGIDGKWMSDRFAEMKEFEIVRLC